MPPREKPILMSAPMVRALLAGKKTQTRRVITPQPEIHSVPGAGAELRHAAVKHTVGIFNSEQQRLGWNRLIADAIPHRFGAPGDRLWVRETWAWLTGNGKRLVYRADADPPMTSGGTESVPGMRWTPSIFMRRAQSRITLDVTSVRVERLNDISEEDARAEGVAPLQMDHGLFVPSFHGLWDSINGERAPWDTNPWAWVVSFERVTP